MLQFSLYFCLVIFLLLVRVICLLVLCMQGRRSQNQPLATFIDNINQKKAILRLPREVTEPIPDEEEALLGEFSSDSDRSEEEVIILEMAAQRVMGDFARPTFETIASAIVLPPEARKYELKHNHLNLLPTYHGMMNEDALQFIREFCTVVQTLPLGEITEDQLKMKCFPYTLKDRAKSWYLSLPPNSLTTWKNV